MNHETAEVQKQRRRTPKQLERKRLMDKATQKQKREQRRAQSRQLSDEIRSLRAEVGRLQGIIVQITRVDPKNQARNSFTKPRSSTTLSSRTVLALNTATFSDVSPNFTPLQCYAPQSPISGSMSNHPTHMPLYHKDGRLGICGTLSEDSTGVDSIITPFLEDCQLGLLETASPIIDGCVCDPRIHDSYEEFFEATLFSVIVGIQGKPAVDGTPPSSPSVNDLVGTGSNVVSSVVKRLIATRNCANLDWSLILGIHDILYRVLRYRIFPSLETFADIPEWLHPTAVQDNIPHPIFSDFIHFPELRNALTLGSIVYNRAEFNHDYLYHISLNWPHSQNVFIVDKTCNMILNPDFESHVLTLDNWFLDNEFSIKHPQMATLIATK
ncbi:BZIP transcription factor [Phlyctema vagabunda]|uniref:BZIP transcription factor n=1 Tax=Phlyctema vagabunda TaxID=108571 RepID=A0ABR4PDM4_9HELO